MSPEHFLSRSFNSVRTFANRSHLHFMFFAATLVIIAGSAGLLLGDPGRATASHRFAPGETLDPDCSPTDPTCSVSTYRPANTYIVADEVALEALSDVQVGDHAKVTSSAKSYIRIQDGTWKALSGGGTVFTVPDLGAMEALTGVDPGDHAEVTSLNKSYIRTQDNVWQEVLGTAPNRTFVVPDIPALEALTGVFPGDHAEVTSVNRSFIRTEAGMWQEITSHEDEVFVVPDIAARDALLDTTAGDLAMVTDINKTFARTQNDTWQEIIASPSIVRLSNTYVVADTEARDALTDLQAGDIAIITSDDSTYVYSQTHAWEQLLAPTANQVISVNGQTGSVVLNTDHIAEGSTNKYFSPGLARTAISATSPLSYEPLTGILSLATPISLSHGGTGATDAETARSNLGLSIGTHVEAWNANLDSWAAKTPPTGALVGTTDTQTLSNKTLTDERLAMQTSSSAGTNDATPEWDGSPVVFLTGANITQTFNLGACSANANKIVSIYVRNTANRVRTINGTNTEGIVTWTGGAKANFSMKNSSNGDVVGATFYCTGTDWLVITRSTR